MNDIQLFKGEIFYFNDSPVDSKEPYIYIQNGALAISNGKVLQTGKYQALKTTYSRALEVDYSGKLIMPGFIDTHVHFAQTEIIGMYGKQLLDWLNEYTFPAESKFSSEEHAKIISDAFLKELFRNGTTTCVTYSTVHPSSVNAIFQAASAYNMRIIAGKVLMDENAPKELTDLSGEDEKESRELIEKWHKVGRNSYAITPRFAISCSQRQLKMAANLHLDYPDTYIQTHLSENLNEIETALNQHKGHSDYLEIYEKAGLLTDHTLLGHCIHLSDSELKRIAASGAIITHCPTSNLFLGSGLFNIERAINAGAQVTLGTDVGAGTSFSLFKTMAESYKIMQLLSHSMSVFDTFYRATLGAARALNLEDKIGSFREGAEADFIVVESAATPVQVLRKSYLQQAEKWTIENKLFGLQTMGDDRNITATYLMGKRVY